MQIPICLVEMSDNHTVSEMETPWGGDDTQLESQHPRSRHVYICDFRVSMVYRQRVKGQAPKMNRGSLSQKNKTRKKEGERNKERKETTPTQSRNLTSSC